MLRPTRQQPAKYNTAPQRPRTLGRRGVDSLLKRNDDNGASHSRATEPDDVTPDSKSKANLSSDIEREPEDSSSEDSDVEASNDHNGNDHNDNSPANDALQVRKYQEQISEENEKKRKFEDDDDERISSWTQASSQRKIVSKNRYGGSNKAMTGSSNKSKGGSKYSRFTNIHTSAPNVTIQDDKQAARKGKCLRKPSATDIQVETTPQRSASKFKRPQNLPASSHASVEDEAKDLENEDSQDKSSRKVKRQFNVPKVIQNLASNKDLDDTASEIKLTRTMRIPRGRNDAAVSMPQLVHTNEVLEGSTGSSRSRAQSVAGSDSSMSEVEEIENPDPDVIVEKVQCPICSQRLPKRVWDEWAHHHPHMSLRDKQKFCTEHTLRTASETWLQRGYPDIQWGEAFRSRLEGYRTFLDDLLRTPNQSFFRAQLQGAVDRGESRTIQKRGTEVHRSNVGYYGLRGLEHISAFISYEFAAELRALAITDAIVAARDQSGYVNMVLVPELVSRLIMDDMDVDVERAREIMEESHALGDLLCGADSSTQRL